MEKLLLKVLIIVAIICNTSYLMAQTTPKWMQGSWTGIGYQKDAPKPTWDIELNVQKNKINVNYPSIPCSGSWKPVKANKNRAVYNEIIEDDRITCMDGRIVITKIDKNFITLSYFMPDSETELFAFSTLQRKSN